jgi:hypothetical protein
MSERAAAPMHLGRPQIWGWLFATPFAAMAAWFAQHGRIAAAGSAIAAALAWIAIAMVRPADRHRVARVAIIGAALTLVTTWFSAAVVAYAVTGDQIGGAWVTIWLVAAPNIGGLLALFRSVQTRAETSATLRELSELRIAALSAPLVEASVLVRESRNSAEALQGLTRMLRLAVGLRLLPREIDRATIWVLDPIRDRWGIYASTTIRRLEPRFWQDRLDTPAPGAGIVSSFAAGQALPAHPDCMASGDVLLIRSHLERHPWFKPNPEESRKSDGMAVALIRVDGEVKAALCLTSAGEVIPVTGLQAREVVDILEVWSHTFSTVIEILIRPEPNDVEHERQ